MVKGAALFLQQGSSPQGQRSPQHPHKHAGDGFKLTLFPREFSSMRLSSPPTLVFSTGLLSKAREIAQHRLVMTGADQRLFSWGHVCFPDGTGSQHPLTMRVYIRSAAFCLDVKFPYSVYQLTADFKLRYPGLLLVAQTIKKLPALEKTQVWSLVQEHPLEKGMAAHSSILAWRMPWTEEPGGL